MILDPDEEGQLSYTGLIFAPGGRRIYMSNVDGSIKVFGVDPDGTVEPSHTFPLPLAGAPRRAEEIPAGLAVTPDGRRLYVCGNLSNRLLELDTETGEVLRTFDVGVAPFDVVLAGGKAYVSNWGGRRPHAGRPHRTGGTRHRGPGRPGQAHRQRGLRQRHRPRGGGPEDRDPRPSPRFGPGPVARRPLGRLRQCRLGQPQRHRHGDRYGRRDDLGEVESGRSLRRLAQRPGLFPGREDALRRQRHPERRRRHQVQARAGGSPL